MVIYEVNLRVDREVAADFDAWLVPHVEQMLDFAGFEKASRWLRMDPPKSENPSCWWVVQYEVESMEALQAYFDGPAQQMREEGMTRFGGRFEATRRILKRSEPAPR